jgi:hypothetical protein
VITDNSGDFFEADRDPASGCEFVSFGSASDTIASVSVNASLISAYQALPQISVPACAFPDGSSSASESRSGTIQSGTTLSISSTRITTSLGTMYSGAPLTYSVSALYNASVSLSAVAGTYSITGNPNSVTVSALGQVTYADPSGCSVTGQLSPVSQTALMQFTGSFTQCGTLNGANFTGLAFLDTSVSPSVLQLFARGGTAAVHLSLLESPSTVNAALGVWTASQNGNSSLALIDQSGFIVVSEWTTAQQTLLTSCAWSDGQLASSLSGPGEFWGSPGIGCPGGSNAVTFLGSLANNQLTLSWGANTFTHSMSPLFAMNASTSSIAGTWKLLYSGAVVTITADGTVGATGGGSITGTVTVPNPAQNLYELNLTLTPTESLKGLWYLDSPGQLVGIAELVNSSSGAVVGAEPITASKQ